MNTNLLRTATWARSILAAGACAAVVAACGSVHAGAGGSAPGTKVSHAKVHLTISLKSGPDTKARTWTLTCEPTSATGAAHPDAAAACAQLLKAKDPFAGTRAHVECPMIVAGKQTATVTGTFLGKHISTTFNQIGCGVERWNKVGQIFH
jgi:hypothetical protein